MPYDVNTSLERLEKSLKNIESAKQQVEKIVGTSNELQEVVAGYVSSLDSLLTNVKDWVKEISLFQGSNITGIEKSIENIQKSCNTVIKKFTDSTGKIYDNLETKVTEELSKFEEANTKLTSQVDKLAKLDEYLKSATSTIDSVKEKLGEVLKELKESQSFQDDLLKDLQKDQKDIAEKSNDIQTQCNEILKSLGSVSSAIEGVSSIVSDSLKEISVLKKECNIYTEQIKSAVYKLDEKFSTLSNQYDIATKVLIKSSNINRWILIISVIILIMLFLFFN